MPRNGKGKDRGFRFKTRGNEKRKKGRITKRAVRKTEIRLKKRDERETTFKMK